MRREDCVEMYKRIPELYHPQTNLVLRNQAVLAVDIVVKFEPVYMVIRGREGGTTDEGRGFFVPYEEISYVKLERVVKLSELKKMCGEMGYVDAEDKLASNEEKAATAANAAASVEPSGVDAQTPPPTPGPVGSHDPASIAKQNLLDRIRATRTSAFGTGGRPGPGK